MQNAAIRLALFQCLAVFYSIVVIGVLLKLRFGSEAPASFATFLRDHGFLLLLLPAAWLLWAAIVENRPRAGAGDGPTILGVGLCLLIALVMLGFFGTCSVLLQRIPVMAVKPGPVVLGPQGGPAVH